MSVANQANDTLNKLLQSSLRVEMLLKSDDKKSKTGSGVTGIAESAKDAVALTGLSTSMTKLIKAADKASPKVGEKLKDFLVNFSEGIKTAVENVKGDETVKLLDSLTSVSVGIHKFALGMVAVALLAPAVYVGVLVFSFSIKTLLYILRDKTLLGDTKTNTESLKGLIDLGSSIAKFALGMVAIAIISPLYILGVTVFALSIKAIIAVLKGNSILGKDEKQSETVQGLVSLGKTLAAFALVMVGIALIAPIYILGVTVFVLSVRAIVKALGEAKVIGKDEKEAGGINTLVTLGKYVLKFALTMIAIAVLIIPFALGTVAFILSLRAISKTLEEIGNKSEDINKGVAVLQQIVKPMFFFAAILAVTGLLAVPVAIGAVAITLSILAIGGAVFLLGKMDSKEDVTRGGVLLEELALPMLAFGGSLALIGALITDAPMLFVQKMAVIGASIVVLGLAAFVLGQPEVAPFVEIGAGVLASLGVALLAFSASLFILSKSNFTKEQADNLGYAMWEIGKSIVKLGVLAPFMILGAAALIPMSAALIPFGIAMGLFKLINWKKEDGESISNALSSVIGAFRNALKGISALELLSLMGSIALIGTLGTGLSSLAAGVKDMATMTFTGTRYNPKTGKLEPVDKVKLTDAEIRAVGPNVASILTALSKPLTEFGEWAVKGSIGFGGVRLGSSYMTKGIEAAAQVGGILTSLAEGVGKMANLEVTEYEVIDAGTSKAKLVPKKTRKLSATDFNAAGANVATILNALVTPLTDFGLKFKDGSTWFTDSGLEAGIKGASMVGGILTSLADGVAKMASLEVIDQIVLNGGTKDAKIVPKGTRKLTPDDFKSAGENVNKILNALIEPLSDFGKKFKDGSTWFTDSGLEAGIKGMAMVADPIAKLADTVIKMASGSVTISEVIGGKIVPKSVISFQQALPGAKVAMTEMLNMFPDVLIAFGKKIEGEKKSIESGMSIVPQFESVAKQIGTISEKYKSITENVQAAKKTGINPGDVMSSFATSIASMGGAFDKMSPNKITMYRDFASTTEGLTKITTPFEKFTKVFGQFTKDMGSFVTIWQKFGKDETLNFKTYADSLKTISTVDTGKLTAATQAIKEQTLSQAVNANKQQAPAINNVPGATFMPNSTAAPTPMKPTPTAASEATVPLSQQKEPGSAIKAGTTIAELRVTNLYLNGILQK